MLNLRLFISNFSGAPTNCLSLYRSTTGSIESTTTDVLDNHAYIYIQRSVPQLTHKLSALDPPKLSDISWGNEPLLNHRVCHTLLNFTQPVPSNLNNNNNNNNLVWWHCHRVALYKMWYKLKSVCREYAKPNRCVFKCFAKVSKPKEIRSTGKAFQLLGPATAKDLKPQSVRWLGTTMSPWAADLKADRSTRHQRSTSTIASKISRPGQNHAST